MRNNFWFFLFLLEITYGGNKLLAQIAEGGTPASFAFTGNLQALSAKIPYIAPVDFDVAVLRAEDQIAEENGMLPRTSVIIPVLLNMDNAGEWTLLPGGAKIWRLTIRAPDAIAIMLYYDRFFIPGGGKLFIYNAERTHVLGAYTSNTNPGDKKFATEFVAGNEIILEYNEPQNQGNHKPDIQISGIGYGYHYLDVYQTKYTHFIGGFNRSCQVNINCSEGNNWQDHKKGVAKTVAPVGNSGYLCSGSLVNNTAQDLTPYYLSAHHCFDDSKISFDQIIFYFHYESEGCETTAPTGTKTMVGAQLLVDLPIKGSSDGALLKLNSAIPADYGVYYNGWDRSNMPATSGVGIHHPKGEVKKIATFTEPLSHSKWTGQYGPGADNAHWKVIFAKTQSGYGQTEGGSSGSPLFNTAGLVTGTLTGGSAANCTWGSDNWYGKLWYHWDNANAVAGSKKTMKDYLDPLNTGVETLNGIYSIVAGNTDLISLTVNQGALEPAFSAAITGYAVNVASSVETITVSAIPADPAATVTGTGNHSLNTGNTTIRVEVRSPDHSASKTYTITVHRAEALNEDMYEPNNSWEQAYILPVSFSNDSETVKTTGANFHNETDVDFYRIELHEGYHYSISASLYDVRHSDAAENVYTVDAKFCWSTDGNTWSKEYDNIIQGNIVVLNGGTVYFRAVPYNEGDMGSYLLEICLERKQAGDGNDTGLSELSISSGVLVNSSPTSYRVTVGYSVAGVTVTATPSDPNAIVSGTGYHDLQVGNNTITVVVIAQNGIARRTYTILAVRRSVASNNANLQSLTVDHGAIYPPLNILVTNYTVNVDNAVTHIHVSAVADDENATVTGTGDYPLHIGNNEISIVVTAENGSTFKTYKLTVVRKDSDAGNANLSRLTVEPGRLVPAFSPEKTGYSVQVDDNVEGILIIAEAAEIEAGVSGNGYHLLEPGRNTIEIEVRSPNGERSKTYTVVVTQGIFNGAEDEVDQPLVAYPNPAREQVIVSGLKGIGILTVLDASGKQLIRRNTASSEVIIPVSALPPGNYLVQVMEGEKIRTIRIVIQ